MDNNNTGSEPLKGIFEVPEVTYEECVDPYEFVDTFGNRLEYAMRLRDVSAADLSKRSGLSEGLISGYRSGRQNAKLDKIVQLAKALNIYPGWLMGFDVPMLNSNIPKQSASEKEHSVTPRQRFLLNQYEKAPDHVRSAIDSLLDMERFEKEDALGA